MVARRRREVQHLQVEELRRKKLHGSLKRRHEQVRKIFYVKDYSLGLKHLYITTVVTRKCTSNILTNIFLTHDYLKDIFQNIYVSEDLTKKFTLVTKDDSTDLRIKIVAIIIE